MKQLKIFMLAAIVALIGSSCEDDKEMVVLDNDLATPSTLLTPANNTSVTLTLAEGSSDFETFTWTKADYGPVLSQEFTLQFDADGNDFAEPIKIRKQNELEYTITNAQMNLMLYDAGIRTTANAYFRIMTAVNVEGVDTLFSEANNVSITIFEYNKPAVTAPVDGSTIVLLKENAEATIDFAWDAVNYGGAFSDRYTVSIDKAGNNFAKPQKIALVFVDYSYSATVEALNKLLIKLDENSIGQAMDYEVRVEAAAGTKSGVVIGDAVTYTLTAYDANAEPVPVDTTFLWVPGDYQGWAPANAPTLMSVSDDGIYVGSVTFPADAASLKFKFTSDPDWDHTNYGDGGDGKLSTDNTAGDLSVPEAGTYTFTVNTTDLTWSYIKE